MKFIVSRKRVSVTENRQICPGAVQEALTPLDYRGVESLERAKEKVWYKEWLADGVNHREENGMVVCEKREKSPQWVINLNSLEELMAFQEQHGSILISESAPFVEVNKELTIL